MASVKKPAPAASNKSGIPTRKDPMGAASQVKILRLGVIQAGKIIEEKLIRRREAVTIGASPRNTIVVPASSLPKSFAIFELHQNQYRLRFSDNMDGRVSVQNQVLSLEQLRQQGLGHPMGGNLFYLPLTENSRGKVVLGEVTLLFQFVTPPPIQPRPQLPPSVRSGFVTNIDWIFTSAFVTLAVVNFGFLFYLRTLDFPRKIEPDVIPDRFAEYIPELKQVKKPDITKVSKAGEKAVEKVQKVAKAGGGEGGPKKAGPAKPCDKECQDARAAARREKLAAQVSKMGVLKLVGSKGGMGNATKDLVGGGDPGTDANRAFEGVNGVQVAGRGGGGMGVKGRGGGGSGKSVGVGDLGGRVGGPGEVGTGGMVEEKVPKAVVKQDRPEIDGTMNTDAVTRTIRLGMAAIRSCYQRALKRNPKLSGKITISMSINTMGKVTKVNIDNDTIQDPQVSQCITGYASRWRFPPPEDGNAEVSVPFVFQSSE